MTSQTLDVTDLQAQIESLQSQLNHPPRSMTHCERVAKMFLLRELQAELARAQSDQPEFWHY